VWEKRNGSAALRDREKTADRITRLLFAGKDGGKDSVVFYVLRHGKAGRNRRGMRQLEISDRQPPGMDCITEQIHKEQNVIEMGTSSIIGMRNSQQDSVFGYKSGSQAIAIVCDGMGGLSGGEIASRVAVESLADAWFRQEDFSDIPGFFRQQARNADEKVFLQEDGNGRRLEAGTTVVAVIVRGNEMYWLSVGDSRIYMIRGNGISPLNRDHNYRMELDARLGRGEITLEEYLSEEYQAEALISYLGMGNVTLMDINPQAFELADGDIVLLSSDGLYRSLREREILAIVKENEQDMQGAADALTAAVDGKSRQDNTSVVILRYTVGRAL